MKIIQVVPRLLPSIDGISDYSLGLAEGLLKDYGILTHYLTYQYGINSKLNINGSLIPVTLISQKKDGLLQFIPEDIDKIILHYATYTYDSSKYTAPAWLLEALIAAKRERNFKLVVMFHEVPFFKTTNFLNPIQSYVAKGIANMADAIFTNCAKYQSVLCKWNKSSVTAIPVFSNIGEPANIPPLTRRSQIMLVFGGISRFWVYKNSFPKLIKACQLLGIKEIYDIGPSDFAPSELVGRSEYEGVKILELGLRPKEEVSQLMQDSMAGFFDSSRFPRSLGKSTVFAVCSSHGILPVTDRDNHSEADGVEYNKHYLVVKDLEKPLRPAQLQTISDGAHGWYKTHNRTKTVEMFVSQLAGKGPL